MRDHRFLPVPNHLRHENDERSEGVANCMISEQSVGQSPWTPETIQIQLTDASSVHALPGTRLSRVDDQ